MPRFTPGDSSHAPPCCSLHRELPCSARVTMIGYTFCPSVGRDRTGGGLAGSVSDPGPCKRGQRGGLCESEWRTWEPFPSNTPAVAVERTKLARKLMKSHRVKVLNKTLPSQSCGWGGRSYDEGANTNFRLATRLNIKQTRNARSASTRPDVRVTETHGTNLCKMRMHVGNHPVRVA